MLGFALLKRSFQFVDIHYVDGKPVVKLFARRATSMPLTAATILSPQGKAEFRGLIEEAINFYKLSGPVAVALDSRLAMVKKVLVDVTTPDDEVEEQINWEMRQALPEESLAEYQYSYESLPGGYYNGQKAFLVVLLRREIVEAVKELFDKTPLSLEFLELDILSSLNAVNRLYGIREKEMCMVADLRADIVNLLVARKGEFFDLKRIPLADDTGEESVSTYDTGDKRANLLTKEARKYLFDKGIGEQDAPIEEMFFFGDTATSDMLSVLQKSTAIQTVSLVEPFEKLETDVEVAEQVSEMERSGIYTISVGSALRSVL